MSMSDCDEDPILSPKVDESLDTETSMATTATRTMITTTRIPGAALRAFLAHTISSSSSSSSSQSSTITSFPSPPPATPFPVSINQSNQQAHIPSEILPRLFISDIFTALNAPTLRSFRITHIISVIEYAVAFPTLSNPQTEWDSRAFPGSLAELDLCSYPPPDPLPLPPLKILHVPLMDLPAADIFSCFATTRDFITTALKDENARVLVHCYKGQSRSPTIVAAYLISTLKISTNAAVKTIQAKRSMVLPNRGFRRQLEQWEVVVREEDDMVCSDK